jgi:hypothetical protein
MVEGEQRGFECADFNGFSVEGFEGIIVEASVEEGIVGCASASRMSGLQLNLAAIINQIGVPWLGRVDIHDWQQKSLIMFIER